MAKKARKKSAAKRGKKSKPAIKKKAAKRVTKRKAKRRVKRKVKRETIGNRLSSGYHIVVDTVTGTAKLRRKLEKPGTDETE